MDKRLINKLTSCKTCHNKDHICQIIKEKDFVRITELIRGAEFFCKNCGRVASKPGNLCNPARINES